MDRFKIRIYAALCLITLSALFLRIMYIENTVVYHPIAKDAYDYVSYGYNLAFYKTFSKEYPSDNPTPDSFRSPGYPLLISMFFLLKGGEYYLSLLYTQAVMSALLVPLTFFLGSLFLPPWWALAAALLTAFSPHLVSMSGYVLTEIFFGFLLLSAFLCFCHSIRQKRLILMIEAAVLFGFAYMTNETALPIPFLLSIPIIFFKNGPGTRKIAIFLLIFSIFPAAWSAREANLPQNTMRGKERAISTMVHGSYPGFIYKNMEFKYFPYKEDPQLSEFSSSLSSFRKILWERFTERPIRYLSWYLFEKPYYIWSWSILQGQGDIYVYAVKTSLYYTSQAANISRIAMKSLHPIIMLIALLGIPLLYICYRSKTSEQLFSEIPFYLLILCLYYTLIYTIFMPLPRYSIPLRPFLYLWALNTIHSAFLLRRKIQP